MKTGWLVCDEITKGMFSDELVVVVTRSNGEQVSYFVPADKVEREQKRVRVRFGDIQGRSHLFWATLPTSEPVTIPVEKSYIVQ